MEPMFRVRFILLVAAVAVIGHDLTYLVAHGIVPRTNAKTTPHGRTI